MKKPRGENTVVEKNGGRKPPGENTTGRKEQSYKNEGVRRGGKRLGQKKLWFDTRSFTFNVGTKLKTSLCIESGEVQL